MTEAVTPLYCEPLYVVGLVAVTLIVGVAALIVKGVSVLLALL